ncbi:MAG: response regulator [Nitrosomonadales bacterium]|nr:response regulator [Nitrosomonadales bacterium]
MKGNQHTILLVEDDPVEVERVRRACDLCELHPHLAVVDDSTEALEWLSRASGTGALMPGLILLDLKLPKLNGLAVLRRLRMDEHTWDLPIVVYSGEHEPYDVVLSYQIGANSFVYKPADTDQFNEMFHELIAYWMRPRQRKLSFIER